jgi:hypothetical protein
LAALAKPMHRADESSRQIVSKETNFGLPGIARFREADTAILLRAESGGEA